MFTYCNVENCICFKFVITLQSHKFFVHCINNDMINCRLKRECSMFDEGQSKQIFSEC